MIGLTFGRLTVIRRDDDYVTPAGKKHPRYVCVCRCGTEKSINGSALRLGMTTSCGCYGKSVLVHTTHGEAARGKRRSGTYISWAQMRSRCNSATSNGYENYGGRGIRVCERWASFENFLADMGERPSGASIDRIDVNGDYEPSNCRWADRKTQNNNTTRSVIVEHDGEARTLAEWAEILGVSYGMLRSRIRRGWSVERALS